MRKRWKNTKSNIYKKIIAVIPAFNEAASIGNVILSTQKYVNHIIVCNDGSSDETGKIVLKYGVNLINNLKRMGKGYALRSLFKEAIKFDPDIIIAIDADGQHDPNEISKLIEPIMLNKSDMVIGSRFLKDSIMDISLLRNIGLHIINFFYNFLFNFQVKDTQSGFRAFSKKSFIVITESNENCYGIESEQLVIASKRGIRVTEVPVNIRYKNLHNTSKKNFVIHGFQIFLILLRLYIKDISFFQ